MKLRYKLKRLFTIKHIWETHHSGIGFKTGNGMDISIKRFSIGLQPNRWFSIITDIKIEHNLNTKE